MNRNKQTAPKDLGKHGKELWQWLCDSADGIEECRPAVAELCRICDRLAEVREHIAQDGLIGPNGRRNVLCDLEVKLSGQFSKLWRGLGLADKPDMVKRSPGRPPDSERLRKWPA